MHETKCKLIERNGLRCMLCGKEVAYCNINWHHIKPKYASKEDGEQPDNSYSNGSLVCVECHQFIHQYSWHDEVYQNLMNIIRSNKK